MPCGTCLFLHTISYLQVAGSVTVDPEALEKIKIVRADFMHALEHDIKPAFGSAQEYLDTLVKVRKRKLLFQDKYYQIPLNTSGFKKEILCTLVNEN